MDLHSPPCAPCRGSAGCLLSAVARSCSFVRFHDRARKGKRPRPLRGLRRHSRGRFFGLRRQIVDEFKQACLPQCWRAIAGTSLLAQTEPPGKTPEATQRRSDRAPSPTPPAEREGPYHARDVRCGGRRVVAHPEPATCRGYSRVLAADGGDAEPFCANRDVLGVSFLALRAATR